MKAYVAGVLVLWAGIAQAADVQFQSGPARVSLLELYTSEGCSSCPPAEEWLSRQAENPDVWKTFVPVAFHVDYWNRGGWIDPFSSAAFTARQRAYGNLYTPCVLLDGKEWKSWRRQGEVPAPDAGAPGTLTLRCKDTGEVRVTFETANAISGPLRANICLLGFDRSSQVTGGENAGRTLVHDFVVLKYQAVTLVMDSGSYQAEAFMAWPYGALGIAAWISPGDSPVPIQAVGGMIRKGKFKDAYANTRSMNQ